MANYTKTQLKKRAIALAEMLEEIADKLDELKTDIEDEAESIEPYEDRDELTYEQEERQEWLENTAYTVDYQLENLREIIEELNNID